MEDGWQDLTTHLCIVKNLGLWEKYKGYASFWTNKKRRIGARFFLQHEKQLEILEDILKWEIFALLKHMLKRT